MIITLILLCVFIVLLHHLLVHHGRTGRLINLIPGPPAFPLVGSALQVLNCTPEELWNRAQTDIKAYYPTYKAWSILSPYVFTCDPDNMEVILNSTKHIEKGASYKLLRPWLNEGLLLSKGLKWHTRRKVLTPAFHFHMLNQFVDILIEEGNRMTESLKNIEGSAIEDIVSFINQHTLSAICETAMGTSLRDVDVSFRKQYCNAVHETCKIIVYRHMKPWFHYDKIFSLTSLGKENTKHLKILHGFTERIIAERKCYHERTNGQYLKNFESDAMEETKDVGVIGNRRKRLAMLDILIAASRNNELSDADIREEVDTFMFEGHDTVAMGICFALLLLAEHKDIQDRVREEVHAVLKENGGKFTTTALQNLSYLERCLKESLRLYPSVPRISRTLREDVKLPLHVIPSGTSIFLFIYELHRDSNYWPNPDVFDPDRFLPENSRNRHPYCYLPFSAGPRNCIGQRFAMLELKAIVAPLVYNFYLQPIDSLKNIKLKADVVIRIAHPVGMRFVPIKRLDM